MSTSASSCSSCPPCQSCQDSSLSTAANILAILTFIYAIAIGIIYRLTYIRSAENEMKALAHEKRYRAVKMNVLRAKMMRQTRSPSSRGSDPEVMTALFADVDKVFANLETWLARWSDEPWERGGWVDMLVGFNLVSRRDQFRDYLGQVRKFQELVEQYMEASRHTRVHDLVSDLEGYKT